MAKTRRGEFFWKDSVNMLVCVQQISDGRNDTRCSDSRGEAEQRCQCRPGLDCGAVLVVVTVLSIVIQISFEFLDF